MISRPFGCEFEFSSEWGDVEEASVKILGKRNLKIITCDTDSANNRKWHLKKDGSTKAELATPVCDLRNIPKIVRVIKELGQAGISVSKKDGFHVHVFAGDVDPRNLVATWIRMEPAIFSMVPKHRATNKYCYKLRPGRKKVQDYYLAAMEEVKQHWASLSLYRMDDIETAEIRIAEGTIDQVFVESWIHFCLSFIDYAKTSDGFEMLLKEEDLSPNELLHLIGVPETSAEYLLRRAKKFGR
jgi:hypothetical protein